MKQVSFKVRRKTYRPDCYSEQGKYLCPVGWSGIQLWLARPLKSLFLWDGLCKVTVRVAPHVGVYRIIEQAGQWSWFEFWNGKDWVIEDINAVCVPALRQLPLNMPLTVETEWLGE